MFLYVWTDFQPDYTGGIAFALAHSEEEARESIVKDMGYTPSDWGTLKIHTIDTPIAFACEGGS